MKTKYPTYFFPGMGASEKMFYRQKRLTFEKIFLPWVDPLKGESIEKYALRYAGLIPHSGPINLVGVSFGGVLAIELSKILPVHKLILISSVGSKEELPLAMKIMRYLPLHKLMPSERPPLNRKLIGRVFGIRGKQDLDYFIDMISEFNFRNIKWAVNAFIYWKQRETLPGIITITGDNDRLFSARPKKDDIIIRGGTHHMIIDKATEINKILEDLLNAE